MTSNKTFFNGVEYPSFIAACIAARVSYCAMQRYLRQHPELKKLSFDDQLAQWHARTSFRKSTSRRPLVYAGVTYPSIKSACRSLGVEHDLIYCQLRRGFSFANAVTHARRVMSSRPVDQTGKKFNNLAQMARAWGLAYNVLYYRLTVAGWNVKKALTRSV